MEVYARLLIYGDGTCILDIGKDKGYLLNDLKGSLDDGLFLNTTSNKRNIANIVDEFHMVSGIKPTIIKTLSKTNVARDSVEIWRSVYILKYTNRLEKAVRQYFTTSKKMSKKISKRGWFSKFS